MHVIVFPPAYCFLSRRLQSLSLLSLHSGDELFLLVVRKQAAGMTCLGVRSTGYGRCSAKAPLPSLAFLVRIVKILRERFWKRHAWWSGWDWMQSHNRHFSMCLVLPIKISLSPLWFAFHSEFDCSPNLKDGSKVSNPHLVFSWIAVKLIIPWVEVQKLERTSNVFMADTVRVTTANKERDFSTFLNISEAFRIMEQLADVTLRRLLDNEIFELDPGLQDPTQITKR